MDFAYIAGNAKIIESLSETLMHFAWQGLFIAVMLKLILLVVPQRNYHQRYAFAVIALVFLSFAPILTFTSVYNKAVAVSSFESQSVQIDVSGADESVASADLGTTDTSAQIISEWFGSIDFSFLTLGLSNAEIVFFWLLGVMVAFGKFSWDVYRTYRLSTDKVEPVSEDIQQTVDKLISAMSIRLKVRVLKSAKVSVPVVVGWLKPVVLLPIAVAVGLEKDQLSLILAHELAHIRRLDFLVNLLQGFLQVLFFFHPCIYWINKVIREEREFICDSAALEALGDDEESRLNLAKALLNTAELKQGNYSLMAVAASGGHLKKRVYRIIANENRRLPSANSLVVLASTLLFSLAAMASTVTNEESTPLVSLEALETNVQINQTEAKVLTREDFERERRTVENSKIVNSLDSEAKTVIESKRSILISEKDTQKRNSMESETSALKTEASSSGDSAKIVIEDSLIVAESSDLKVSTQTKNLEKLSNAMVSKKPEQANRVVKNEKAVLKDSPELNGKSDSKQINNINDNLGKVIKSKIDNNVASKTRVAKLDIEVIGASKEKREDYAFSSTQVNMRQDSNLVATEEDIFLTEQLKKLESIVEKKETSAGFTEPKAISTPYPRYPAEAFDQRLTGQIKVDFVINEDGRVVDLKFVNGGPRVFVREIKRRLRRWVYQPAVKNGKNVEYAATMYFEFDVPENKPFYIRDTGTRIKRVVSK